MGSKPAKSMTKVTELSNFNSENGDVFEEFDQIRNCCGIQYITTIKKEKLLWENTFIFNCQSIKHQCRWANQLLQLVNKVKLSRTKYIVEVNQIKKNTESLIIPENQILLTPGQVEQFKANLKKSVLLSFGQAKQQLNEPPKITTTINPQILQRTTQKFRNRNGESFRMSRVMKNDRSVSNKRSSRSDLRKSIMSFVDDTLSSVFGGPDKEISKQNAKAVENFLNFSMIIQKHMADDKNILNRLQKVFISYMKRFYSDPKIASRDIESMTTQIKQYLVLMRETVFDYYNLISFDDEDLYALITNQQNVLTVLTSILFKDKEFYQLVFNAIVEFNLDNDDILAQILTRLQNTTPQFFGILDQYCLNELTLNKSNDRSMSLSSSNDARNIIDNLDVNQLRKTSIQTPFKVCMDVLRELERSRTPVGKMKIIMSCSQNITKCISRFYQSNGLKSQHWVLDADQILSIFCYILANARVPHLHTHLFILQNFSTDHQLISVTGYYYSVLTCALEQIEMNYRDLIA